MFVILVTMTSMPAISSSDSFVILVKIGPNLLRLGLSKSKTLQVLQQGKEKRDQAIKQGSLQPAAREGLFKDLLAAWQNANRICLKDASVSCYQNLIDAHILPELGNKRMHQINASTINRFLFMKLEWGRLDGSGGLSAAYVRSMALIISSAIGYGASEKICTPLMSPITKPSPVKKELLLCQFLPQPQQCQLQLHHYHQP